MRRLELSPLLAVEHCNQSELARRLGCHRKVVCRWSRDGLTTLQADRIAVRLGYHPIEVWGPGFLRLVKKPRPTLYEPDLVCDRIWHLMDVRAEQRRVLAERWVAA